METKMKFFKSIVLFSFLFIVSSYAQNGIRDIIKPVNLTAGKTDSLLISDMFYSNNYNLKFQENKEVKVNYNKRTGKVYFKADMNFAGMTLVDFKLGGKTYSFPVRSRVQQKFKFSYKPEKI